MQLRARVYSRLSRLFGRASSRCRRIEQAFHEKAVQALAPRDIRGDRGSTWNALVTPTYLATEQLRSAISTK